MDECAGVLLGSLSLYWRRKLLLGGLLMWIGWLLRDKSGLLLGLLRKYHRVLLGLRNCSAAIIVDLRRLRLLLLLCLLGRRLGLSHFKLLEGVHLLHKNDLETWVVQQR